MKKQQGFTLIELMIVVAVIGVLSAIAIPAYQDYAKKGALGSALATATALKTPVETYISEVGEFPADNNALTSIPNFEIGTIAIAKNSSSSANGTIKVTLSGTSASGAAVTLTKTAGTWDCSHDLTGITVKGCQ